MRALLFLVLLSLIPGLAHADGMEPSMGQTVHVKKHVWINRDELAGDRAPEPTILCEGNGRVHRATLREGCPVLVQQTCDCYVDEGDGHLRTIPCPGVREETRVRSSSSRYEYQSSGQFQYGTDDKPAYHSDRSRSRYESRQYGSDYDSGWQSSGQSVSGARCGMVYVLARPVEYVDGGFINTLYGGVGGSGEIWVGGGGGVVVEGGSTSVLSHASLLRTRTKTTTTTTSNCEGGGCTSTPCGSSGCTSNPCGSSGCATTRTHTSGCTSGGCTAGYRWSGQMKRQSGCSSCSTGRTAYRGRRGGGH